MSDFLPISEIDSRRKQIGLLAEDLYEAAGVSRATWYRAVAGSEGTRIGALSGLTDQLLKRERDALAHLLTLHPDYAAEVLAEKTERAA
tara:strand:+ start:5847 stop:6113 length:267 start_codon:yes stop_codon:yes gene_type:complete